VRLSSKTLVFLVGALFPKILWAQPRSASLDDEDAPRPVTEGATVRARVPSRETVRRELTAEELRRMAGTRGDALLAVQNLPGVGRPAFGQGIFIVRGSDPDDSLVLLEGHPIALPFHFYGLATTVSTDLIERIEFLPGNFSARWGRIGGGVINVTLRAPPTDRVHVQADVDVIDAGVTASVPLGRRVTVTAGIRRSYIDGILALLPSDASGNTFSRLPRYWDWQLAVDVDASSRDHIRVLGSGSEDVLGLNVPSPTSEYPDATITYGNSIGWHGAQARWRHRFAPGIEHTLSGSFAYTTTDISLGPDVRYAIRTLQGTLRDELDARLGSRARLYVGIDAQGGRSDASITAPPLNTNGIEDAPLRGRLVRYADTRNFLNTGLYAEVALAPSSSIRVLAGIRADWFSRLSQWNIDPRVSAQWTVHPSVALRAGFGGYTSTPRGYTVLPGFGNPWLPLVHWQHATLGTVLNFLDGALEITLDGFAKYAINTPSPTDVVVNGVAQHFAATGRDRVLGAEFMARLRPSRLPLVAWLSYTFQRAEHSDATDARWYASSWDQPHNVTLVLGVVLPRNWEVGLRGRYTSGSTEPTVTGGLLDTDHDITLTYVDRANPSRLPSFFSLDVRASKRFRWGPTEWQMVAEVLNVTNQQNIESRVYSFDRRSSVAVTGLPIIPNLGLRVEY
jgi:hypothetical protein